MKISTLLACCALSTLVGGCAQVRDHVLPPRPVVVAQAGTDGLAGLDYTANVSCTVRNDGGDGPVRVTATFVQGGLHTRSENLMLRAGEQRDVVFVFPEATMFSFQDMRYRCSAA